MRDHAKVENGLDWMFDFTKLQKVSEKLEPTNPVVPVVVQDINTREVLILAYANEQALRHSFKTGNATFWSTSRNELWEKGKTSGDVLKLREVRVNCDQNSLLYLVEPAGKGACHVKDANGNPFKSCYYRKVLQEQDGSLKLAPANESVKLPDNQGS